MRSRLAAALLASALLSTLDARAQKVVVFVGATPDAALVDASHRLVAELRIHRFETESMELAEGTRAADAVTDLARTRTTVAAAAPLHAGERLAWDVWIIDRVQGTTTSTRIVAEPSADATSVLAIRVVDLLRATSREFEPTRTADVPPKKPGKPAKTSARGFPPPLPPASRAGGVTLTAEAMLLAESPGFGVALGPSLGAFLHATNRVSVGVVAAAPLLGATYESSGGRASLLQGFGIAEARLSVFGSRTLDLGPALAGGAWCVRATGTPRAPLVGTEDLACAAIAGGGAFVRARLTDGVFASASPRLFVSFPRMGVAVGASSQVIGLPLLEMSLGIAVEL